MKFEQLPGTLDVEFVAGDEVTMAVDVDISIVGYSLEAPVYVVSTAATGLGGTGSAEVVGDTVTDWTITVTDAAAGTIALGLSETQTAALSTSTTYRWFLRWVDTTGYTRTVLSGTVKARNP